MKKIVLSCCAAAALLFSLCAFLSCSSDSSDPVDPPPTEITYTIELSKKTADLSVDRTLQLAATVVPSDPSHTDYRVEWSSLNQANASVDANGLVTALAEGTARIQAKVEGTGTADVCTVTIHPKGVITYNVSVEPNSIILTEGETAQLKAIVEPSDEDQTDYEVVWTSSSSAVTVTATGEITAVRQTGSTATQVKATVKGTSFSGTCYVTVNRKPNEYTVERIYRVTLTNKGNGGYSTSNPSAYLSSKAIARRTKRGIAIDESDFPIANSYLKALKDTGVEIATTSKWLSTVTVYFEGDEADAVAAIQKVGELDFVEKTELVWQTREIKTRAPKLPSKTFDLPYQSLAFDESSYGSAWNNIHIHNGEKLHEAGYMGEGIHIAVVDAGFNGLGRFKIDNNPNIIGTKSFIHFESDNIDREAHDHGTHVLSCLAGNQDGKYIGTAPKASYWLLRTEHKGWEMPFEEDNMIAAFEYADSVGVDIISCSLTYTDFDDTSFSHSQSDLDGKTVNPTRAAEKAFSKGILMVNCAGNESRFVGTPADAEHVLTVGGITPSYTLFTAGCKGWVGAYYKPDVLALADPTPVITPDGTIKSITGTSFATPIIAGLAACLWQAYPNLTNQQLLNVIRMSSDKKGITTDSFGIPNMETAMQLAGQL